MALSWDAGGIVGVFESTEVITACANLANVTAEGPNVGGIVGWMDVGKIEECYNVGNITGKGKDGGYSNVGGILGRGSCSIEYCYNKGEIAPWHGNGGGMCGKWYGDESASIQNCYNIGIIPVGGSAGAIVGRNDGINVNNCFWTLGYRCIGHGVSASDNCKELTEDEMKAYTNTKFILDNKEPLKNDGYPILYWQEDIL